MRNWRRWQVSLVAAIAASCDWTRLTTLGTLAAMIWLIFYSEFEWWGQKYKPSEEVCLLFVVPVFFGIF